MLLLNQLQRLKMTKVVNLNFEKYDVYIGRPGHGKDGYFGNKHPVDRYCPICKKIHTRAEAIAAFKVDFYSRIENDKQYKQRILALKDKVLGCFCKPGKCHGDIIAEFLNKDDKENKT